VTKTFAIPEITMHSARVLLASLVVMAMMAPSVYALGQDRFVTFAPASDRVQLAAGGVVVPLVVDAGDHAGVLRATHDLQSDFERVTGTRPELFSDRRPQTEIAILIGTLGRSSLIAELSAAGRIDVSGLAGVWEGWLIQTVGEPLPGIDQALVIVGSDRRGTIFGIYELSEQIGVSPWYWWADVPVTRRQVVAVEAGTRVSDRPAIRYRGIFLNDEAPALSGWVQANFGGFNHRFYEHVFELILRLRGNFLWPAMWGRAFNDDDLLNPRIADEYGVVMSTSHHEPMQRAHVEWDRYGEGPWDYARNAETLREFWRGGFERTMGYENIVTLGMRGDGDEPMSEDENIDLLEQIVADQRQIIAESSGLPATATPQVWTLYKEVQGYYERGMRVPDDVTLLWSDDNWGNIRRLPTPEERSRSGGAGVYYHFDYVGGPRNYKWLNITPISKVWEQMNLAWHYGAQEIWVVNVGDLKPMEFPIEFFLNLAWAPERWPYERLVEYGRLWAEREFGAKHAEEIAALIAAYTKFNRRRSPELLSPDTYSLVNYGEADRIVADYRSLADRAEVIGTRLGAEYQDAFFQLVSWPIKACANLNELYVTAGRNRLYGEQGRAATNLLAERVRELFAFDAELTRRYNEDLSAGKWNHFADQVHIGYTYWQQPPRQTMPAIVEVQPSREPAMAVAVEGKRESWGPGNEGPGIAVLPVIDVYERQMRRVEVFNRGLEPFSFTVRSSRPWLRVEPGDGVVDLQTGLTVGVDWASVPPGEHRETLTIEDHAGNSIVVQVPVFFPEVPAPDEPRGFVETDGHISIEAEHFSRAVERGGITWEVLPDFGRTLSGVTPFPVTAASQVPEGRAPRLEYDLFLFTAGEMAIHLITAPSTDFVPGRGLRLAVSVDDGKARILDVHSDPDQVEAWERTVADSVRDTVIRHAVESPGRHVLKIWMVDPGVVLQRIVIDLGGVRPSYLGPPESSHHP
jgi:hypothetical protein